jgi:hypothetical protein
MDSHFLSEDKNASAHSAIPISYLEDLEKDGSGSDIYLKHSARYVNDLFQTSAAGLDR